MKSTECTIPAGAHKRTFKCSALALLAWHATRYTVGTVDQDVPHRGPSYMSLRFLDVTRFYGTKGVAHQKEPQVYCSFAVRVVADGRDHHQSNSPRRQYRAHK